jgi:hypothetical protein
MRMIQKKVISGLWIWALRKCLTMESSIRSESAALRPVAPQRMQGHKNQKEGKPKGNSPSSPLRSVQSLSLLRDQEHFILSWTIHTHLHLLPQHPVQQPQHLNCQHQWEHTASQLQQTPPRDSRAQLPSSSHTSPYHLHFPCLTRHLAAEQQPWWSPSSDLSTPVLSLPGQAGAKAALSANLSTTSAWSTASSTPERAEKCKQCFSSFHMHT